MLRIIESVKICVSEVESFSCVHNAFYHLVQELVFYLVHAVLFIKLLISIMLFGIDQQNWGHLDCVFLKVYHQRFI